MYGSDILLNQQALHTTVTFIYKYIMTVLIFVCVLLLSKITSTST